MNRLNVFIFLGRFFRKPTVYAVSFFLVLSMPLFSVLHAAEPEFSVMAPLASKSLLLAGVVTDGRAVVVGERGHILFSDDQGDTWTQARVPTIASLTGVYFHDKKLGWAVGHDAVILRTTDGGENWERVHFAPEEERPLFDVWFKDDKNGVAIGAYGFFLTTKDGGISWTSKMISEDDWHLNQIKVSENGRLYIAGEAGMFYRSDDGGETWINLPTPYEGSFFGVLPLGSDTVLLFGLRGNLFRSEDAGENWQKITTQTKSMLNYGMLLPDGRIFIMGLGGTVLVSDDDGKCFTLRQQPNRKGILSALPIENNQLILVGQGGVKKISITEK
jgi:photosystem II stability/assembly factor-like uncharacterized protein